jgi:threonine dehydrogenase-like Zn-dependent dehydrogenase
MVLACDRVPHRLDLARRMGADGTALMGERDFRELVMDLTRGRGVDIVYDAAGAPETISLGLRCLRPGGALVLIGIPEPLEFAVDLHAALARELRIQTVRRSNHKGAQAAALLAAGRIPTSLITHRMALEQAQEGFEMLHSYADGVGKLVFDFDLKG